MSIGKYSTKLYHRGRSDYSCCVSGLITIGLLVVILLASISILTTTFSRTVRTLTETSSALANSTYLELNLLELEEHGINPPLIRTAPMNISQNVDCSKIIIKVVLSESNFDKTNYSDIQMK